MRNPPWLPPAACPPFWGTQSLDPRHGWPVEHPIRVPLVVSPRRRTASPEAKQGGFDAALVEFAQQTRSGRRRRPADAAGDRRTASPKAKQGDFHTTKTTEERHPCHTVARDRPSDATTRSESGYLFRRKHSRKAPSPDALGAGPRVRWRETPGRPGPSAPSARRTRATRSDSRGRTTPGRTRHRT